MMYVTLSVQHLLACFSVFLDSNWVKVQSEDLDFKSLAQQARLFEAQSARGIRLIAALHSGLSATYSHI